MYEKASKYRSREPNVIEAIQWDGTDEAIEVIRRAFHTDYPPQIELEIEPLSGGASKVTGWRLSTPEGFRLLKYDEWIVRNRDGTYWTAANSFFQKIYVPADRTNEEVERPVKNRYFVTLNTQYPSRGTIEAVFDGFEILNNGALVFSSLDKETSRYIPAIVYAPGTWSKVELAVQEESMRVEG